MIIVEAVCLILLMTAVYCQALDWNCAVAAGIILQILGTLGFAHLQLKYEDVKNMEEQVKRLELQNQEEYERYVELERKYRQLHQDVYKRQAWSSPAGIRAALFCEVSSKMRLVGFAHVNPVRERNFHI